MTLANLLHDDACTARTTGSLFQGPGPCDCDGWERWATQLLRRFRAVAVGGTKHHGGLLLFPVLWLDLHSITVGVHWRRRDDDDNPRFELCLPGVTLVVETMRILPGFRAKQRCAVCGRAWWRRRWNELGSADACLCGRKYRT